MLYIDFIGGSTVRLSNEAEGAGRVKFLKNNLRARQDSLGLVWISNTDNWKNILNCYNPANITLNGTVYSGSSYFVGAFNSLAKGGEIVFPTTTTTTEAALCGGTDFLDMGLSSAEVDVILNCHAALDPLPIGVVFDLRGNDLPTAASADAIYALTLDDRNEIMVG